MLTLKKTSEGKFLCWIYRNKKRFQEVFWHPFRKKELRNAVQDLQVFNTEHLRDKLKLTRPQASILFEHLKNESEPEANSKFTSKFFKLKKFVTDALYSEMDLSDQPDLKFVSDFPDKKKDWPASELVAGASSSGKTYYIKEKVLRNLKGPPGKRRQFLFISNEFDMDDTLAELRKPKYKKWVHGIDVSDDSIQASIEENDYSIEEYFKREIRQVVYDLPPGSVIIADDLEDSLIKKPMFDLINRALRTFRHRKVGIMYILHRIRSGKLSSQGHQSVKYITVFPKSQRGKILDLFIENGQSKREAVRNLEDFKLSKSRSVSLHMFNPTCLISEEYLRLF